MTHMTTAQSCLLLDLSLMVFQMKCYESLESEESHSYFKLLN